MRGSDKIPANYNGECHLLLLLLLLLVVLLVLLLLLHHDVVYVITCLFQVCCVCSFAFEDSAGKWDLEFPTHHLWVCLFCDELLVVISLQTHWVETQLEAAAAAAAAATAPTTTE
jgi:hypothetical protein